MHHYLQEREFKNPHWSFIKPYIEYVAFVWNDAALTNLDKLDRNLRKLVRVIMFKDRIESVILFETNKIILRGQFVNKIIWKN